MPISVRDLYNQICDCVLEPSALTGDVLTDDQFIEIVNQVISQFLELGPYIKPLNKQLVQGQRIYESPGPMSVVKNLAVDQIAIPMNSGWYWDQSDAYWENVPEGEPQEWRQDQLEVQGYEMRPAPSWNGYSVSVTGVFYGTFSATSGVVDLDIECDPTAITGLLGTISECDYGDVYVDCAGGMFGTIASMEVDSLNATEFSIVAPQYTITSLDDYIPDVSQIFLPYLRILLMRVIFSNDAETKSVNASRYYTSRTQECTNVLASITQERTGN